MADTDEATPVAHAAPVDAAQPTAAAPLSPPVRRSSVFPAVTGGAIAAILGFGAAQFVPDGWPLQSTAALEANLATQTTALATAQDQISRLAAALDAVEARPVGDPAIADRIAAIEQRPVPDDSSLTARLTAVEQGLAAVAALPTDGSAASPAALSAQAAALAALQTEVAALKAGAGNPADIAAAAEAAAAQLAEAEARAAELRTAAEADAAQAMARTALRQIAVAMETGGPFESAISAFADTELPAILTANARTGLPTLTDLQGSFSDAARQALNVALRADMGDGWTDRIGSFLRSQTGARSTTPREGDDPDAVLSRAEAALSAGSVTDVLALLAVLPQVSQDAMTDWSLAAQTYVAGQEALATLTAAMGAQE